MKPIVIYLDKKDNITLSKEDFEKYLSEAYDAGYSAGYANAYKPYVSYPWWKDYSITTTNTPQTQPLKITWDSDHTDYTPHITCDGLNDISNISGVIKNEKA